MLKEKDKQTQFEQTILGHLDAAFNLARWMIKNDQDAEDIVQESFLRAYKYFSGYQGGNGRSWLLTIVRNTCYTWLRENQVQGLNLDLNEEISTAEFAMDDPEQCLQMK